MNEETRIFPWKIFQWPSKKDMIKIINKTLENAFFSPQI